MKNKLGNVDIIAKETSSANEILGIELAEITDTKELKELGIEGGVQVTDIKNGAISKQTNMKTSFIITKVNRTQVYSVEDVNKLINKESGGVLLEGIYPGYRGIYYYAFGL